MPKYKLSDADIQGIRFGRTEGMSYGDLAAVYGVSRTQIFRIVNWQQRNVPTRPKASLRSPSVRGIKD